MVTTIPRLSLTLLAIILVVYPPSASARGFVPNFANGFGFLVPSPEGGLGCGYFNYINCFPQVTDNLRRLSGQLQAVYAAPAAYEPSTKVTIQTPKTARAAAAAAGVTGVSSSSSGAGFHDAKHNKEVPVVFLQETRGDVFAEASAGHVPDAAAALDKFRAMSDAARALQNAAVLGMRPGAQHVAAATTAAITAGQDKALATLSYKQAAPVEG